MTADPPTTSRYSAAHDSPADRPQPLAVTASSTTGDRTEPEEVTGAQFRAYRAAAGYVVCEHPDGAQVTGQDARDALQAIAALAHGPSTPVLVDLRATHSVSRDARKTFASSAVPSRIALCVESSLSRVIANFFISVSRPSVPTKMFTDLNDAQRWLLDDR